MSVKEARQALLRPHEPEKPVCKTCGSPLICVQCHCQPSSLRYDACHIHLVQEIRRLKQELAKRT